MCIKIAVIRSSDAVVDPRAVMVVSVDTLVANVTVAALRQSDHLAERA